MNVHITAKWRRYLMLSSEWSSPFCWLHHFLITNTIGIDFRPLGCTCGLAALISVCLRGADGFNASSRCLLLTDCATFQPAVDGPSVQPSLGFCRQNLIMCSNAKFPSYRCYIFLGNIFLQIQMSPLMSERLVKSQ